MPLAYPNHDIHQILTTSAEASVSLHVLCNDLGVVERQSFDPEAGTMRDFVSGYKQRRSGDGHRRVTPEAAHAGALHFRAGDGDHAAH